MTVLQRLQNNERIRLAAILVLSLSFTGVLILSRVFVTQKVTFIFLIWNLILAFIPFAISSFLIGYHRKLSSAAVIGVAFLWLIFLPNAPYILTDLFHLKVRSESPIWFDLMIILSAAWNGLILGLLSLRDMQEMVEERISKKYSWLFVITSLLLCGFGIYIGRYLRWNSWDILTNPLSLLSDLFDRFVNPLMHPRSLGVTLLYMTFLLIAYLFMKQLSPRKSQGS